MRPLLFYIGYCLSRNKVLDIDKLNKNDKMIIGGVTASLELENISSYYINHFLDDKADIQNEKDKKNRVLAGLICRDLAMSNIDSLKVLNEEGRQLVKNTLVMIDYDISLAQSIDINELVFDNINKYKNQDKYLEAYFNRCRLISGQFYGRCVELGIKLGNNNYNPKICRAMTELYTRMSTLGQYGNDIGDFAPPTAHSGTQEKNYYKDYGSDLINGRLTYPNYLLLTRANRQDLAKLNKIRTLGFSTTRMKEFLRLMKDYEVVDDCLKLLKNEFKRVKQGLALEKGDLRTLVSSSLIIFKSNKLLVAVRDAIDK